jgi:hypothetical protein
MNIGAQYWEQKAKKARDKAKMMSCDEARHLMLDVARRYSLMAAIVSKRSEKTSKRLPSSVTTSPSA